MATIYAYSSNSIYCTYTLNAARSGSTVTITASGTIYGNGSSSDSGSGQALYAQLRYGVDPSQTYTNPTKNGTGTTTYVSSYGTLLENLSGWTWTSSTTVTGYSGSTNSSRKIADNDSSSFPSLNATGFPESGRKFTITWTATNNNALNLSNVALFFFKSATSTSIPSNGAYIFIGKKDSSLSANYARYYTQSLSVEVGYEAVGAPTSISINKSISIPYSTTYTGDKVVISWSGATNKTSNPITGYKVYWKYNGIPTTSDYDGTITIASTTTSSSWTLNSFASNSLRGTTYYFKVQTIGTQAGYNSGISSNSATIKCNSLPTTPTISIASGVTVVNNTNYVKSSGGTVKFTPSASDTDGQTVTYYYATSSSGTKTAFTSNTSFSVTADTTYYFWSYDSLEYSSSYTTKTIAKNIVPSFTLTTTANNLSSNVSGSSVNYVASGSSSTSSTIVTGTAKYTWGIQYNTSSASATGATSTSLTGSTGSLNWVYPGSSLGWNNNYRIYCKITDSVGDSTTEYTAWYKIPLAPTFNTDIYNQWSNNTGSNVSGSHTNDFYQTVVAAATIDTGVSSINLSISPTVDIAWQNNTSITTYKSNGYIPLKITNTSAATSYTLTIKMATTWGASVTKTYTITRTGLPRIDNSGTRYSASNIDTANPTSIRPFYDTSTYNFNFLKPNVISSNNFVASTSSNTKLFLYYGNNEVEVQNQGTWSTSTAPNYITVPATRGTSSSGGLYNWATNSLNLDINGSNIVGLRIKFIDVFGQTYSIDKANYLTLNFLETPSINLTIDNNGSSNGATKKEGDTITYNIEITAYNTNKAINIKTYIYRSTSYNSQTGGSWELYSGTNTINGGSYTPSRSDNNAAITHNESYSYTVGQINESKYLHFKVIATPFGDSPIESDIVKYYISQRHKTATISALTDVTFDTSNQNLGYKLSISDYGAGQISTADNNWTGLNNANYGLQFCTNSDFTGTIYWLNINGSTGSLTTTQTAITTSTSATSSYTKTNINLSGLSDWSFYNVRPVYWTIIDNNVKTTYGESFILYNISPTVSYRQNQIGININGIEDNYSDSSVVIGAASGKTDITIVGTGIEHTININTGALNGFILDGGSW